MIEKQNEPTKNQFWLLFLVLCLVERRASSNSVSWSLTLKQPQGMSHLLDSSGPWRRQLGKTRSCTGFSDLQVHSPWILSSPWTILFWNMNINLQIHSFYIWVASNIILLLSPSSLELTADDIPISCMF